MSHRNRRLGLLVAGLLLLLGIGAIVEAHPRFVGLDLPRAGEPWAGGAPRFDPRSGQYDRSVLVKLEPSHPQGEIVFTTDGTVPTTTLGTRYRKPLILDADYPALTVVRAREVVNGVAGEVGHASYLVGLDAPLPVVSLTAAPADLWGEDHGILTHPWERGREWERPVHITYLDASGEVGFEVEAGLRTHRIEPFDADKQSLRLYFRRSYGAARLSYPLFPVPTELGDRPDDIRLSYDRLLLQAGVQTEPWSMLRDQLIADAVDALDLRASPRRFVWLFINGEPWGIYHLSERIDRFFLEKTYGIDRVDVVQDGRSREGSDDGWDSLIDWVEAADLTDPADYARLKRRIDLENFTDFAVLQLYFGTSGEAWFAAHPLGGRWFWLFGGETKTFASDVDAPIYQSWEASSDFARILRALLANPDYRRYLADRATAHLDTALAPDALEPRIDAWVEAVSPAIVHETTRWPKPTSWESEVAYMRRYVRQRGPVMQAQLETIRPSAGSVSDGP